ncbi:MAG: endonuclease/exonuclease/phosphatase family protein [Solitalea-like symbiont of Tyrophagus putrescentiae]
MIDILSLLLSYISVFISPAMFWPIAFFGLLFPVIVVFTIILLSIWIFIKPLYAVVILLALVIGIKYHLRYIAFNFTDNSFVKDENVVRVMSYNVHFFRKAESKYNDILTKDKILKVINEYNPDLLCMQEFLTRKSGKFNTKADLHDINQLKNFYIYKVSESDVEYYGLALFSKFSVIGYKNINFTEKNSTVNKCIILDVKIKNKIIRIFNVHLRSIGFDPYDITSYKSFIGGEGVDHINIFNIVNKLKKAFQIRALQADLIAKEISESPYPVVVCGDFNDTVISYAYNTISKNLKDTFLNKGSGFLGTYNGVFPNFRIDYLLVSKDIKIRKFLYSNDDSSDHFPIAADLIIE